MYENNEFTGYMIDEASTVKDFDFSSVYRSKEFTECMKFFDTNHDMTRKVLLSVNEADQSIMMQALASKLYGHIVNKVDDIDFGTIPNSKGDITKIDKYEQLCDCINVLSEVLTNYNQPTDLVDTVSIALQNLVDRRDLFIKAYRLNADMPIMTYNTIALSVVSATSLLIASSIEFIKLPGNKGFDIAFDKTSKVKGKEKILYKNLSAFNKMCANDQFDKAMEFSIKNSMLLKSKKHEAADIQHEAVPGFAAISSAVGGSLGAAASGISGAASAVSTGLGGATVSLSVPEWLTSVAAGVTTVGVYIAAVIAVILIVRELIYLYFYMRTKLSDYFDAQSSLLVMNAYNVENNLTKDEREKSKIVEKQNRIAKYFAKLSNALKVKERTAELKAGNDIDKDNKTKYTYADVVGNIPDSSNAALF